MRDYWNTQNGFILRTSGLIIVLVFFAAWFTKTLDFEPLIGILVTIGGLIGNFLSFAKTSSPTYSKNKLDEFTQKTINVRDFMLNRFGQKATMKEIHRRIIAMDGLKDKMVWREEEQWLQEICYYLERFENQHWRNRKFRILYGQYVTKRISILDYLESCIVDEPKRLFFTIKNIYDRFEQSSVSLLSVRDILEDYDSTLAHESKEHFARNNLIEEKFPHPSEKDKEQHAIKPPTITHKGLFPPFIKKRDIIQLFSRMEEIRDFSEFLVNEGATISLTHIVLSFYRICSNKPIMLISASNTFKDRLKIFSDIPIVVKDKQCCFYGDPSMPPSTEAIPHWIIHSSLHQNKSPMFASVVHVHNEELTTIAEYGEVRSGSTLIPTIPHHDYGTEEIGHSIVNSLLQNNAFGVTVKAHGQWFVGESFEVLCRDIIAILREIRAKSE